MCSRERPSGHAHFPLAGAEKGGFCLDAECLQQCIWVSHWAINFLPNYFTCFSIPGSGFLEAPKSAILNSGTANPCWVLPTQADFVIFFLNVFEQ